MNKTQPTPEEITAVVSEQPDLYQPTVQPLDAVQDNGYFPIEVDAEDKELAAPSLAKLATPSSDRNWLQRFKVAAKTAVSNILNGQMTHNVALGNKRITFGKNKEEIEFGRRMASEAKRQIEEVMDGTEELTAEEAETWAAALGGGSVSMVDFAANLALLRGLGAGSVGAQLGAGWLAGRAGYEEGTMSDIDKYIAETGDKELKNYKGDKKAFAVNVASGAIQGSIEAATSGLGRYLINNPLAKKVLGKTGNDAIRKMASTAVGRTLAAGANESVNNAFEEWTQALTGNIAEIVKGNEEFSMDNILNGAGQAAGVGALLGWVATPVMQEYGRRKTRDWISDKLRKASEEKGIPLTEAEIKDASNDLVGIIESKGVQQVSDNYDKINQLAGAESDLAQTLSKVFEDLVNQGQIKFRQATPDEIRQAGLDWANYMQATALLDSLDREIPISAHPLFNAVAEADRIFLEGRDPGTGDLLPLDINNAQVRELANQIEDYIEQNRETRQAEEASKLVALREADMRARQETIQELERAAIAELEKEQVEKNQERITELQQQITELQHQMDLLREERSKYIQERAAQGRISIGRAKAQTAPDNKALTKKAIRSGNLDIIKQILQDNGFKTRDLSGTQTKQMAQLNWEMFAGKDLGTTKSKYNQNVAMKAIEQNVVSGDAVLLRAGYTQGQIDQMDDKTWNRALQAAYQEETEALKSVQPQLTPEQAAQIPDDMLYQDLAAENARLDDMYPAYTGETINIDGKERTVYNSNGERIAQSEPALRNFWNWFGDSKVVDDQGRPLVVYHGTLADVKEFKKKKIRRGNIFGKGFYFTNSKQGAELYSSGKTLSVYLSFQKPFVVWEQEFDFADGEAVVNAITEYGYTVSDTNREEILESESPLYTAKINYGESTLNAISNILARENGYDSLIGMTSIREFVAFEPNQIKSTENTGEFGIGVDNMYHQDQVVKKVGEDRTNANDWGTSSAQEFSKSFDVSVRSETIKRIAAAFYKGEGVLPEMLMHYQPGYVSLPVPEMIGGKLDVDTYRATTPEEKTAALKDLTEKRPWTLLQNKKTSKSTTGLGTEHRGGYDPMTKAIIFNKTSDLTTLFHESAHYWFDRNLRYYRTGLASPEWKKKWEEVMNELGATPNARGTIPVSAIRSASEKFARSMEAYLREGKYESAAIQWAHQDYANMVKRVYRNIWSTYWGLDDLSPAVKQWFDMFGLKTDDATTAFAEEDKIETDEQMVGAVVAEDATKPDVDAETKTIVADAGAQVVENPATQEIAVVPADPFETGKKARSKLPRSAEAATGVSMDDIIYNRRSMSDAFKAAQQLVNTDPVRAWEILKGGQEMVDGLYAGDIYRALVAKYQAENNPTMLKNVVQAFAGAARRAGRSVKAFDLESPRISFEKTINSLDKIFDTKKNDKRIEKVKNELKEFLHDPSALRVGWEEFKNIVGCK